MTTTAPTSAALSPEGRLPDAEVDAIFVERWSRRAFADRPVSEAAISTIFEAARWAPSANNFQPWLFVYAHRPESLASAHALLVDFNQRWATRAPLLVFIFARKRDPKTGTPLRTALFDTGAAWQSLALQAHKLGLSTRAMGGIHHAKTHSVLGVPEEDFESIAGIAIGYPGERESLPSDLHAKEQPNSRKSTREFAFEGRYQPT
jgi:nitroreductase